MTRWRGREIWKERDGMESGWIDMDVWVDMDRDEGWDRNEVIVEIKRVKESE